ncbi:MAG: electron transport complex subunit E [Fibrobacteres bacterium]|nr:electron transport complex subunit E [Fibrobacterota bacterium]
MNILQTTLRGIIKENPLFVLVLGTCPSLAVTTSLMNGIGMGVATTVVLIGSNAIISVFKSLIPSEIRIPSYIVIIATFVTAIDLLMQAYTPALSQSLGLFVPLIVVNCIVLGRAEAFASKNGIVSSLFDGLGMGLGFTLALALLGASREVLGGGTILGYTLIESYKPAILFILPPGAFITLGFLIAAFNRLNRKGKES